MTRVLRSVVLGLAGLGLVALLRSTQPDRAPLPSPTLAPAAPAPSALAHVDGTDGLRLEVLALTQVSAAVLEVRFALSNQLPTQPIGIGARFSERPEEAGTVSAALLISEERAAKHFVLRNSDGTPACSDNLLQLAAGERREVWARFVTPGAPGARVTFHLPQLPPVRGLSLPAGT
ncbi:MAG: hypothetical protein AB7I50_02135 [Vicinamibacterales bacterium]